MATRVIHASAHALVHPSVATSAERTRHAAFLTHTLAFTFSACAVAPFFLAFHGAPTPGESLLFALALVQMGAAMLVARTGRLVLGHRLSFAGLCGVSLVLFFGLHAGLGVALAWLVTAELEALTSFDRRLIDESGLVAGATLLTMIAASLDSHFATQLPDASLAALAGLAFVTSACTIRRMATLSLGLQAAEAAFAARSHAVDAALDATIVTFDAGGAVRSLSRSGSGVIGAPDHAMLGRGLFDHVHVADRPAFLKLIDDAANGPATATGVIRLRIWVTETDGGWALDPRHATVEMRAHGVPPDRSGSAVGPTDVVAILRDVTDRDRREQKIETSHRLPEETQREKDLFLTTMSHELRTPLNSIIGFSDILASRTARPDDIAKQYEFARIINRSGRHLLAAVNAVLDTSRLQMGAFPIHPEAVGVATLLDQSCESVATLAKEAKVQLARDYPTAFGEIVGDERALTRALVALLSHAIKVTPEKGRVTLTARRDDTALVIMADTAVGMVPESLPRVGDPSHQPLASFSYSQDGAGVGFALARGLVGLHGGSVSIECEPGGRTAATIRLPFDCRPFARKPGNAAIEMRPPAQSPQRFVHRGKDAA